MYIVALNRFVAFSVLFLLFQSAGWCQGNSASELKVRLLALADKYMNAVDHVNQSTGEEVVTTLFKSSFIDSVTLARESLSKSNQKFILADKGLRGGATYADNFTGGFEDLGFFYRRAFTVGVDWSVLREGFLDNKYSAKQQFYQDKLNLAMGKQTDASSLNWITNQINANFDKGIEIKRKFLLQFVIDYEQIGRDLFLNRYILWEDLLKLKNAAKDIEVSLALKDGLKEKFSKRPITFLDSLPVFELNEPVLNDYIKTKIQEDSLVKMSALVNQYKYPYWREISLRPYMRYNFYSYDVNDRKRDFLTAGFLMSAPLMSRKKSRQSLGDALQHEILSEVRLLQKNNQWLAAQLISSYRSKLTDYSNAHHKSVVLEEQLRKESVKRQHNDPDFSAIPGLMMLKEWMENDIQTIILKKDLYLLLAKIGALTNDVSPTNFVTMFTPESIEFKPHVKRDKAIYVWSHGFMKASAQEFVDDIQKGGYSKVILSINHNDTLKLKALDVIGLLSAKNIEVHLMIANNEFIYPKNKDKLLEALQYNLSVPGIAGIHLDIEPHTLPDLKEKKDLMYNYYVEMIETVSSQLPAGNALSVSIPLSYELTYLQKVNRYLDRIYLMAYEHPDAEYIIRKTKEEVSLFQSKATIALRTKDFSSVEEMELMMDKLGVEGGFGFFAIHDYSGLVNLKK